MTSPETTNEPRWHEMTYAEIGAAFRILKAECDYWRALYEQAEADGYGA